MISAEEFIKILEDKDLLDPSLIAELRRRVEQSMAPVSAALLAKRLVDKGHLSRKLAQRLLDQPEPAQAPSPPASKTPAKQPEREKDQLPPGLAPLEEEQSKLEELADIEQTEEEDWQLMPLDDEPRPPARSAPGAPAKPAKPARPSRRRRFPRRFPSPSRSRSLRQSPSVGWKKSARRPVRWAACWTRGWSRGNRSRSRSAGGGGGKAGKERSKTSGTPTCC
ncbi:MAG: hypothetical protein ACOX1P_16810 [Thermoguttaceae bacterium]